jgi:preprotein translocase subunit SecB
MSEYNAVVVEVKYLGFFEVMHSSGEEFTGFIEHMS